MNFKPFFLSILFAFAFSNNNIAQECDINLSLEEINCNFYNPAYNLSYDYLNPTSGARFYINGNRIQDAEPGENVSIFLDPNIFDIDGNYTIILRDTVNTDCADTILVEGFICHDCALEVVNLQTNCSEDMEEYDISFDVLNIGPNPTSQVRVNSNENHFGYFNVDETDNNFHIAFTAPIDVQGEFTVTASRSFCNTNFVTEVDCTPEPCSITNIEIDTECDYLDSYTVLLSFDHSGIPDNQIWIKDIYGINYGAFDVTNQPISIEVFNNYSSNGTIGFILENNQSQGCIIETPTILSECYDCELEIRSKSTDCTIDQDNYTLELQVFNQGSFVVTEYYIQHLSSGQVFGPITSNNSIATIEAQIPFSLQGQFRLHDTTNTCEVEFSTEVGCSPILECQISLDLLTADCFQFVPEFEVQYTYINQGIGAQFYINGLAHNNPINADEYGSAFLAPGFISPNGIYTIVLQDTLNKTCADTLILENITCEEYCTLEIANLTTECIAGEYHISLDVLNIGIDPINEVNLIAKGSNQNFGTYNASGSINTIHIEFISPTNVDEFEVVGVAAPCSASFRVSADCDPDFCSVKAIDISSITCNNDGTYNVFGTYQAISATENVVLISANESAPRAFENNGSFSMVIIDPLSNNENGNLEICVNGIQDCCAKVDFTQPECILPPDPCENILIKVDSFTCLVDGTYNVSVISNGNFISINGGPTGWLSHWGSDRINVTPNENSDYDTIEICLDDSNNCCKTLEYLQPSCLDNQMCSINEVSLNYDCLSTPDRYSAFIRVYGDCRCFCR